MYAMAAQLAMTNNTVLWYGILGLTDQYVHQRITPARYLADFEHFKQEVADTNETLDDYSQVYLFVGFQLQLLVI